MTLSPHQQSLINDVDAGFDLKAKLSAVERDYLWAALYLSAGIRPNAAALLGITQPDLRKRILAHGMQHDWPDIKLNEHTKARSRTGVLLGRLRDEPWAPRVRGADWVRLRRIIEEET
jgi:Bacterial regulatory protein, Fis family